MNKIITRPEVYHIPVGRIFGRPYRETSLPSEVGRGTLRNMRPLWDWRLSRMDDPPEGPRRDLHLLTYAIRDGSGFTGRPAHNERLSIEACAEHLTKLALRSPADLWLAFTDASTDADDGIAMARFMGVVVNPEKPGPRYQPVVQTKLGELALVPNTYEQGWLHVEVPTQP